jgi:hypothetical protein
MFRSGLSRQSSRREAYRFMPPPLLPDTCGMGAAARDIRAHAGDLRRHRATLSARCDSAAWHSPAATAFRHRAAATLAHLDACAHALEAAAAALDRHAHTASERLALLAAAPKAIEHAGADIAHGIGRGLHRATHWGGG